MGFFLFLEILKQPYRCYFRKKTNGGLTEPTISLEDGKVWNTFRNTDDILKPQQPIFGSLVSYLSRNKKWEYLVQIQFKI